MQQSSPSEKAAAGFTSTFGAEHSLLSTAPGRVNLIGEHTDYNDGFVLPAAINFYTATAAAQRSDRTIDAVALDVGDQRVQFSIDDPPHFDNTATWSNYLRGVVAQLRTHGYKLCGANLTISGNVPLGAGLSSSAALEMSTIAALTGLSGEAISTELAAKLGQAAENEFVGCQCGIMDQLISAAGQAGHAMLLDCRSLETKMAQLPQGLSILVVNSNVQRALVDGEYNQRRAQCEAAAQHFGVIALRDISLGQLLAAERQLDATTFRRARHVVTENQRTLDTHQALAAGDIATVAQLMAASHESMRHDFEITVPEIDQLVDIIKGDLGSAGGVRMTGGGFGGCVVALLPQNRVTGVLEAVAAGYKNAQGQPATSFLCQASDGAFT